MSERYFDESWHSLKVRVFQQGIAEWVIYSQQPDGVCMDEQQVLKYYHFEELYRMGCIVRKKM